LGSSLRGGYSASGSATRCTPSATHPRLIVSKRGALSGPQLDVLVGKANDALWRFDAIAATVDGLSFERRLVDDDSAAGLTPQARYADLAVLFDASWVFHDGVIIEGVA
jgi:hypothetical protein